MSRRLRVPSKPNLASVSQDHPEGWPCYLTARTPYDKPQIRAGLRLETVRLHNELPYCFYPSKRAYQSQTATHCEHRKPLTQTRAKKGDSQIIAELEPARSLCFLFATPSRPKNCVSALPTLRLFRTDRQRQSKFSYAQRAILSLFGSFLTTSSLLTLFSECFSSFARATCSLSVSGARYSRKKSWLEAYQPCSNYIPK